ncbi:MAG: hypothetical protein HQL58_12770 [Magnetococcales bacterium]|nr:hypothetical protein [Magnetococcales bacterium]
MERLVTNLLNMVRIESGACRIKQEWIPFEELLGSALARIENRLLGRPIKVHVDQPIPLIYVDPVLFEQVLINILDNAIKYTPEMTPIIWTVTSVEGYAIIRIRDKGPGIPIGEEQRIFEKFSHGKSGGDQGIGLGLAICKGVIQAHGGSIELVHGEKRGAEFCIMLPHPPLPPETLAEEQELGAEP